MLGAIIVATTSLTDKKESSMNTTPASDYREGQAPPNSER